VTLVTEAVRINRDILRTIGLRKPKRKLSVFVLRERKLNIFVEKSESQIKFLKSANRKKLRQKLFMTEQRKKRFLQYVSILQLVKR